MTFQDMLLAKITERPGSTDAALAKALGKIHQHVNQEANLLANRKQIARVRLDDGLLHNYPHSPLPS